MKNNKKQERKKKKLRTLILLLFLTIIMFGTSTYAWFTANRTVIIQEISVNVQASDGLQISTDGKTWKSTITTADILQGYDGSNNFIPAQLDAVSTVGATRAAANNATRLFDMYSSTIGTDATTGNYTITTALVDETASPKKFVAFDVFLRVSADKDVYLNSASAYSKVFMTTGSSDRGLKQAARVGFVPVGEAASDAALADILGAFYTSNVPSPKIWEPNNDLHSAAVVNSVAAEYGYIDATTPANSLLVENPANSGKYNRLDYSGISTAIQTPQDLITTVHYPSAAANTALVDQGTASTTNGVYSSTGILLSTPSTMAAQNTTNGIPFYKIFRLKAGITKMRIYMWVEGQDLDCENNASGTDITFHLELTIPEAAPASSSAQGGA